MDYPATQMFVSDEENVDEDEDDENSASPLGDEKNVEIGVLIVDSVTYPVHKGVNKVGRIESCSIVIDHNTISKEHAEIEAGLKSIFISDLGSLNKTKLNDITLRPEKMYQLQDGDVVRFGLVQAVFKLEEKKEEKPKSIVNDFVIPETPVSASKEISTIIPGTPDLSFEDALASRSSTEGNNSSDILFITGTQQGKKRNVTSGVTVCDKDLETGEISMRSESTPKIDRKNPPGNSSVNDISELEMQKNISATDSDEDNIFEMMTQKSNVHEEEKQKFGTDDPSLESRFSSMNDLETQKFGTDPSLESRFSSINDIETQKFGHDDTPKSHVQSINDLETQKFGLGDTPQSRVQSINDLETQKFDTEMGAKCNSRSINDLETQKFFVQNVKRKSLELGISNGMKQSISDAETQKYPSIVIAASDGEGSETDEEGLFEDSGGGHDMFDAPTQLIISADRECRPRGAGLEMGTQEKLCQDPANEKTSALDKEEEKEDEDVERRVNNGEGDIVQSGTSDGQMPAAQSVVEKSVTPEIPEEVKKAGLNDSIESKLNNMFDDVNDSFAEEPTQMLTQHLERVLECSQVDRPVESDKESGEVLEDCDMVENLKSKKLAQREEEANEPVFRTPKIMSTQELFADLPAVNIRGTSKKKDPSSTATKSSDVVTTALPSKRPKKCETETVKAVSKQPQSRKKTFRDPLNKFQVTEAAESVDPVVSEVPKSLRKSTGTKSLDLKSGVMKLGEIVGVIDTPTRESDRIKSRGSEESTKGLNPDKAGAVSPGKAVNVGKKLPPKKRGFPVASSGEQPAEIKPEIAKAVVTESPSPSPGKAKRPRIKRGQVSAGPDETPARLAVVVNTEDRNLPASEAATPKTKGTRETRRLRAPSSMIRIDYANSESRTPIQSATSAPIRKGNPKSRESEQETLEVKNETENTRGVSQRLKKKALEKSVAAMSEDELAIAPTPAKRPKSSAKTTPTVFEIAEPLARPETPVSNTRGRGKRKLVAVKDLRDQGSVESTDSKNAQSNNTKISMRGRKARSARDSASPSSVAHFNEATQSSLESQEIQAILSGAEMGASQTPRQSFRSSSRAKKEVESIEKPTAKPVATKKQRTAKVAVNQTTIEEFLKPKSEPKIALSSPRTRGRPSIRGRKVTPSRTIAHPAEKENAVEEVGGRMKRGNKNAAEPVASSNDEAVKVSPLRRGRSSIADQSPSVTPSAKKKHKILFTGISDPQLTLAVSNLGGTVTEKPNDCTALVTDKVRRTYKFLCAMAMAVPIVPVDWLKESERRGRFLDTRDFLLQDPVEEAKFNFDLRRSLELAKEDRLLDGYTVVLTPNTAPPPTAEMKGIIQACGGKVLARPPTTWPDKSLVISRQEDVKNAKKFLAKAPSSVPLVSVEFLLTGILRHELNFEEHKLKI